MLTYKEVYDNRTLVKVITFRSLADITNYANDRWAYSPNCKSIVYPQEDSFVPGEYFVSEKEFISGHSSEVIVAIQGVYRIAKSTPFVAGKIYNVGEIEQRNHIWKYFFRIKD